MSSTGSPSMPDPNLALGSSAPPYPVFIVRKPASAKPSMAALVGPPEVEAANIETPGLSDPYNRQAAVKTEELNISTMPKVEEDTLSDDSDDGLVIINQKQTESPSTKCFTKSAATKIISTMKDTNTCEKPKASPQPKPRKEKPSKNTSPLIPGDSRIFSTRAGEHFMDGPSILANFDKFYMRPWDDCISSEKLSLDNMPPFFRRLRNDQVGHLVEWINDRSRVSITLVNASAYWPYDMNGHGAASRRDRWGKAYNGKLTMPLLIGGPTLPTYINMGLPLTWTSSGKAMCPDAGGSTGETGSKRKADQMMDESVDSNGKRFCVWAKPQTHEDVIFAFTNSLKTLKEDHKIETDALKADITARDATIEALNGEKVIALEQINNHDKVLRDKDAAIDQLEVEKKEIKKTIDDLKLNIEDNKLVIDGLKREKDDVLAELNTRDQTITTKNAKIETLHQTIEVSQSDTAARERTIAGLQDNIQDEHTKISKLEAKIKRTNTELQTHKTKYGEEYRARQALEAKKKTELSSIRKNLKDATTKLKSQETTIAEKEKLLRDTKKQIAHSNTKILDLEVKIKMMDELITKNEQNYTKREERIKHLETKIGFFGQAFNSCRELDEKEIGEVQGGDNAGLKVMEAKDGVDAKDRMNERDSNVNRKDTDADVLLADW